MANLLSKYRQEVHAELLFVSVDLSGSGRANIGQDEAHPYDIQITGFSEQILRFIAERGDNNQLQYVKKKLRCKISKPKKKKKKKKKKKNLRYRVRIVFRLSVKNAAKNFDSFFFSFEPNRYVEHIDEAKKIGANGNNDELEVSPWWRWLDSYGKEQAEPVHYPNITEGGQWRDCRVFISSTFLDMHAERDCLTRIVFPELKERSEEKKRIFFETKFFGF